MNVRTQKHLTGGKRRIEQRLEKINAELDAESQAIHEFKAAMGIQSEDRLGFAACLRSLIEEEA